MAERRPTASDGHHGLRCARWIEPAAAQFAVESPNLPRHGVRNGGSALAPAQNPKLLDTMRLALRVRHYSPRTEQAYRVWARRFIVYHSKQQPSQLGAAEVQQVLDHWQVIWG